MFPWGQPGGEGGTLLGGIIFPVGVPESGVVACI